MLRVSIIIPAFNEEKFLEKSLFSIKQMELNEDLYETILVDNGSTDGTPKIAERYGATVISFPEGKTISAVRNKGAITAQGDILAFLDADCIVAKNWLTSALDKLDKHDIGCIGSRPVAPDEGATWVERCWGKILPRSVDKALHADWLSSSNVIVKAHLFHQINGFDERLATSEDVDLGHRLNRITKILYDPSVKAYHLKEPKSLLEFIKKEIWHGKSNFKGFVLHGFPRSELLSIIVPLAYFIFIVLFILGLFTSIKISLFALVFLVLFPLIMTYRNLTRVKDPLGLLQCFAINCSYILGRALSVIPSFIDYFKRDA